MIRRLIVGAVLLPVSAGLSAQSTPEAQAVQAYAEEFGISASEAARRLSLQDRVNVLYNRLQADPQFSGMKVIQNRETFRVLVKFKGRKPSPTELTEDPELQSLIDAGASRKSQGEFISLQKRINAAALARKFDIFSFPDPISEKGRGSCSRCVGFLSGADFGWY